VAWLSGGKLRDCPISQLLQRLGKELGRREEEILPHAHRLVTLNWLEDIPDLDLVEERHWDAWGTPEKLVVELKATVRAQQEQQLQYNVAKWCNGWFS